MIPMDSKLVLDLRRRSPAARPEGFDGLPVVDDYEFKAWNGGLIVAGLASHGVNGTPSGYVFETAPLTEIDGENLDTPPTWVRSKYASYRLGLQIATVAPVVLVATSEGWHAAFDSVLARTGRHTLSAAAEMAVLEIEYLRAHATDKPYRSLRARAAEVSVALLHQGRGALAQAWELLSANPADAAEATDRAAMLETVEFVDVAAFENVIKAWRAVGLGQYAIGDDEDPVAGIQKAVRWLRSGGEQSVAAAAADDEPPFVQVANARDRRDAWAIAQRFLDTDLVAEANLKGINSWMDVERMRVAKEMAKLATERKLKDASHLFALLGASPTDKRDLDWVVWKLTSLSVSGDRHSAGGRAHRAWLALADLARLEREPHDRTDAFVSAHYATSDLLFATKEEGSEEPEPAAEAKVDSDGVVVLRAVGGTTSTTSGKEVLREFDKFVGKRLKFVRVRPLAPIRARLADEFPHLTAELDVLLAGLVEGQPLLMRPVLLAGEPGGGKSRLARRLAKELSVPLHRYDGSGSADNAFGGTARRWSSGEHSVPLEAVRRGMVANPWVLVDELDKAGTRRDNGRLSDALIPFLERETAERFADPYVQSEVDLSNVGYVLTANDDSALPAPLKDRLRIVRLPQPRIEHLPQLARSIVSDLAKANPLGPEWVAALDDGELAIAEGLWKGGSTRRLAAIVRAIVERRQRQPRN